ncbi:MAG: precorrin-2 C(20)-methyltransferase [Desulfovibrionaceae bacterium]|nr:precorrin-2 C(20)-methyltransferase [Desulfovibrionaceae bacterium]
MNDTQGTLYGLGMGPGDPDLVTLKAVKILAGVDVVFAAASTKNDYSLALAIASGHLPENTPVVRLDFPMTRDPAALQRAWRANAALTLETLRQGRDAAFVTLGDPMTYSTFGYLRRAVLALDPAAKVVAVPGITAPQAAAAAAGQTLAESGESFAVVSGVAETGAIRAVLQAVDSAAILKAYRCLPRIRDLLSEMGLQENARFVTKLGMPGERINVGLGDVEDNPSYFSLILVKKQAG